MHAIYTHSVIAAAASSHSVRVRGLWVLTLTVEALEEVMMIHLHVPAHHPVSLTRRPLHPVGSLMIADCSQTWYTTLRHYYLHCNKFIIKHQTSHKDSLYILIIENTTKGSIVRTTYTLYCYSSILIHKFCVLYVNLVLELDLPTLPSPGPSVSRDFTGTYKLVTTDKVRWLTVTQSPSHK